MSKKRRVHSAQFKAQVGLDALKGVEPVHAIAAKHGVHPVQVSQWKKEVAERDCPRCSQASRRRMPPAALEREKELYEEIGRLKMELEWLKKKAGQLER
jgi:transposase